MDDMSPAVNPPIAMLAELTHRCPLSCPYCSNPLELKKVSEELETAEWIRVFDEAAKLGVLQLHLSGGEPASRKDLVALVAAGHECGLYINLITSGLGLTKSKLEALVEAGLDHVQLSLQGKDAASADLIGGYKGGFDRKIKVAKWINEVGFPLTINAVCHRSNLDDIEDLILLAIELKARRLEVATVQFSGWAMHNRSQLMPTKAQVENTYAVVKQAREILRGTMVIDFVPADYYATYPKACMGGWGRIGLNVDPTGLVLPCHAAETIPELRFDTVRDKTLEEIWYQGEAFQAFRGTDWMPEPCQSCDRKAIDFGGCRCQAMALVGNAAAVDPACSKSPNKAELLLAVEEFSNPKTQKDYIYRARLAP